MIGHLFRFRSSSSSRLSLRSSLLTFASVVCGAFLTTPLWAQSASLSGRVIDQSEAVIRNASVTLTATTNGVSQQTSTNHEGFYAFPFTQPGRFTLSVTAAGFKRFERVGLTIETAQSLSIDVRLEVGATAETVTVDGTGININTVDASVSTLVDRTFVSNIPLNGRSFQSLISLVPGVAVVPSNGMGYSGEFTVNGQRTEANYYTVDGVSANNGSGTSTAGYGAGYSGATAGQTVLGTTQSLVAVDALEEFQALTSTYTAEYGRTPGGQFVFSTRSGTNAFHGSLFEYFRNSNMDANNWFNNALRAEKQPQKQNDFGGVLGGPVWLPGVYNGRDRTFFFFSYEGMRIRSANPAAIRDVPSVELRSQAPAALQPFLNAFPLPNDGVGSQPGLGRYVAGYSAPSTLDTASIRLDHNFTSSLRVFGRYNYAPSDATTRHGQNLALLRSNKGDIKTLTMGSTWLLRPNLSNDFRFNFTANRYRAAFSTDTFDGATPFPEDYLQSLPGMTPSSWIQFVMSFGSTPGMAILPADSQQRQWNITNKTSGQFGRHNLKWGLDYRRITNSQNLPTVFQYGIFNSAAAILANTTTSFSAWQYKVALSPVYDNFSLFVQDDWRVSNRLSLSLGLRWDVNPPPSARDGNVAYTVTSTDLRTVTVAPKGTPLWKTTYNNFAPRLGIAYQLLNRPGWESVLRTGVGLFYDLGTAQSAMGVYGGLGYSSSLSGLVGSPFPLNSTQVTSFVDPVVQQPYGGVFGFDPDLKLPRTWEWNVAIQQNLGRNQSLTVGYVGAVGRRLLRTRTHNVVTSFGNTNFTSGNNVTITTNGARSDYHSLQVQFQKRLSKGLQALASYTWGHSTDDLSINFEAYTQSHASSGFDIRQNFQAAVTYDLPLRPRQPVLSALFGNWSLDSRISSRTALPFDLIAVYAVNPATGEFSHFRPNLDTTQPLYLDNANAPGGRVVNCRAFLADCNNPTPSLPVGQGTAGRNIIRGFGAFQTNVALRKTIPVSERVKLQFRLESFNVFNSPSFGSLYTNLTGSPKNADGSTMFGAANGTLNNQLGGLNSLFQTGGPRSLQLALRLEF